MAGHSPNILLGIYGPNLETCTLLQSKIHGFHTLFQGRIQNMDLGPWTTPWTAPNFQKEIAPINIKIYWRSGYEKHRLLFIAYVLEGLSCNSRCYKQEGGVPNRIAIWSCWNENIGGRNALDLLYLKTSLWSSHLWGCDTSGKFSY